MKRTALTRKTPLQRKSRVRAKRSVPRRREAPRWDVAQWQTANHLLTLRALAACERCGDERGPFERHHRKRRRDGGDRLSNILLLCRLCHRWVTEHPAEARRSGFIVSVNRDPVDVPVLWQRRVWMSLHDEGGMTAAVPLLDAHE